MTLEAREYNEDSTPEEIEALLARVRYIEGIAVLFEVVPVVSLFQSNLCFGRLAELLHEHDCHVAIIDARETGHPSAAMRENARKTLNALHPHLEHLVLVTGSNVMLNLIVRFLMTTASMKVSVCKTVDEAEEVIRSGR